MRPLQGEIAETVKKIWVDWTTARREQRCQRLDRGRLHAVPAARPGSNVPPSNNAQLFKGSRLSKVDIVRWPGLKVPVISDGQARRGRQFNGAAKTQAMLSCAIRLCHLPRRVRP